MYLFCSFKFLFSCIKKAVLIWNDCDLEAVFRNNTWDRLVCLRKKRIPAGTSLAGTIISQNPVVQSTLYTVTSVVKHCKKMFSYREIVCRVEAWLVLVANSGVVNCQYSWHIGALGCYVKEELFLVKKKKKKEEKKEKKIFRYTQLLEWRTEVLFLNKYEHIF